MKYCPLCKQTAPNFLPLPIYYYEQLNKAGASFSLDDFETLNCGQYSCPHCGASDRERLMALSIESFLLSKEGKMVEVLEIAPSKSFAGFFAGHPLIRHRTADLLSPLAQDKVDICDMAIYQDKQFDLVICSHVLEHVPDDLSAMRELCRVLKPDGVLVVLVPILMTLEKTDEDPLETDEAVRWRRFGQDDHIRIYSSADFVRKLQSAGLHISQLGQNEFGADTLHACGISHSSVLYLGTPTKG